MSPEDTQTPRGARAATPLDAGRTDLPVYDTTKVSGAWPIGRPVRQSERVLVTIADADGQIISHTQATVDVGFKEHRATERSPGFIERIHSCRAVD